VHRDLVGDQVLLAHVPCERLERGAVLFNAVCPQLVAARGSDLPQVFEQRPTRSNNLDGTSRIARTIAHAPEPPDSGRCSSSPQPHSFAPCTPSRHVSVEYGPCALWIRASSSPRDRDLISPPRRTAVVTALAFRGR